MPAPHNEAFVPNFSYHGFTVDKVREVPELRCRLYELHHVPSNARVIHVAADDDENLFCLSFQTVPHSSNGIAHALEHIVLCGSKKFPVNDPFFSMTRRSMNTFMNALTGTDFTCYPAASQIEKDFYNLLEVYLDAVFHPNLTEMSFLQEAHRYEFEESENPSSPLTINGVVFNEMKGSLAKPTRRLMQEMSRLIFPDVPYGFESGGSPEEIPTLTLEELRQFHATFYHPSRCLFFFYGNLPLANHLDFIASHALKGVSALPQLQPIPLQPRLHTPVTKKIYYPIAKEDTIAKSYLSFGWLTTQISNQLECLALLILDIMLLDTDASPLKQRLLQSGKCKQVMSSVDTEIKEAPFVITLTGCEEADCESLSELLFSTLSEIAIEGIPHDTIEHAIHQVEFAKSEITGSGTPFGLSLYMRAALLAHHGLDPIKGLEIHSLFDELRQQLSHNPSYFSSLIRKYFLDNRHFVRILMSPQPSLQETEQREEQEKLTTIKQGLSTEAQATIVTQSQELHRFQEETQDLSCLPFLQVRDVPKESVDFHLTHEQLGTVDLYTHETFCNDIVYLTTASSLPALKKEDLWMVRLFLVLLPQLGCGTRSYEETLLSMQAYTGGIGASLSLNIQAANPTTICPTWHLFGKALGRHAERLATLMMDFLLSARFDERKRIQEILEKHHTDLENSITSRSLEYAMSRAGAAISTPLAISEEWYGLSYLQHIRQIVLHYPEQEKSFLRKLEAWKEKLLLTQNFHLIVCGDSKNTIEAAENRFWGLLDVPITPAHPWNIDLAPFPAENIAYQIPSTVSFSSAILPTVPYTHPDSALLAVLAQLLNNTLLHKKLREQGGAYGGGASANPIAGTFSFYSYRDPNLFSTIQTFHTATQALLENGFSDQELAEAKLSVLQDLDTPIAPGSRAILAYSWWKKGKAHATRQQFRDRLLAVSKADIFRAIPIYFSREKIPFVTFASPQLLTRDAPLLSPMTVLQV